MVTDILLVLGVGGLLGFRHAFEPDHLAAVSTLASRPRAGSFWSVGRLGLAWGLGHTVTVGAIALLVIVLGVRLPASLWPTAELAVAALLVLLGGSVVWRYARGGWHMHLHAHDANPHLHLHSHAKEPGHEHAHAGGDARRSLGFGVAHGLAGSGAIAVLLVAAAPTAGLRLAYFAAFGLGSILGMLMVSVTLGMLVKVASERGARWATLLHVGAAGASVLAGLLLAQRVLFGS
jgi:ABC-type nickel/cobalt efflux system permease component RcnA